MIYTIVICIMFFCAAAIWLVRFITEAGFKLPDNRVFGFLTADKSFRPLGESITRKEYFKIFLFALAFRVLIFLLGWLARCIFNNDPSTSLLSYFNNWSIWDASHYVSIATYGYNHPVADGRFLLLVFFPLYPWLMRLFNVVINNYAITGVLISTLCYSFGCVLMYKLVTLDYSKAIAKKSIVLLSVYPFAFYYGGIMTESLFFMLIIAVFLAIRLHNWLLAGILGVLASLTRSFGVFMLIPAAVEWVRVTKPVSMIKDKQWKQLGSDVLKFLPVLITVTGILIYLFINYRIAGDPFIFIQYDKENWSQSIQFFGKTTQLIWTRAYDKNSIDVAAAIFLPELAAIFFAVAVMLYGARRTKSMYTAFMLVYFVFNTGASWPLSLCRYLSCMFPMFWVLGDFTERHKSWEFPLTAAMAIGLGIYLTGYITYHQIM